jgi:hypothetical protein
VEGSFWHSRRYGPSSCFFHAQQYTEEDTGIKQDELKPVIDFVCDWAKKAHPNQKVSNDSEKLSCAIHELWMEAWHPSSHDYDGFRRWVDSGMPQNSKLQEELAALLDGEIERTRWMDRPGEEFVDDQDLKLLSTFVPTTVRVFAVADTLGLSLDGFQQDDIIVLAEGACYPLIL